MPYQRTFGFVSELFIVQWMFAVTMTDQSKPKLQRRFLPFRSSANITTIQRIFFALLVSLSFGITNEEIGGGGGADALWPRVSSLEDAGFVTAIQVSQWQCLWHFQHDLTPNSLYKDTHP